MSPLNPNLVNPLLHDELGKIVNALDPGTFTDVEDEAFIEGIASDLKGLCDSTKWKPGLWLSCHSYCGPDRNVMCGGLNNARNRIQSCLRLAIDAGAGMILPSLTDRQAGDIRVTNSSTIICPDVWWDIQKLTALLGKQCPGFNIRKCGDERKPRILDTPERDYKDAQYRNGEFRDFIEETLQKNNITDVSEKNQVVVYFGDSHIAWNYRAAGELATIRKALFKVFNFNARLLEISTKILQSEGLNNGSFIGVHLRGEGDWPDFFGTVGQQTFHYIKAIEAIRASSDIRTIYVSCGDMGAIQRFREQPELQGYQVVDKNTLSHDPDFLREIDTLGFDERGIVEYNTLVGAEYFLGIMTSTMSDTVAYARTLYRDGDYFTDYIFPGSFRTDLWRSYPGMPYMMGDEHTRLIVYDGVDLMDGYP